MTFEQWQETRFRCADLGEYLNDDSLIGHSGFIYAGDMFIAQYPDTFGFWTIAERDEISGSIFECERWLWDNFARAELANQHHSGV